MSRLRGQEGVSTRALIAIADHWDAVQGKLYLAENEAGKWKVVSNEIPISFGVNGLVWADQKVEGDRKSPAGIFKLGPVYGQQIPKGIKMEWNPISADLEAVDDPKSKYYNRIVKRSEILCPDWVSSEKMSEIDLYDQVLVIGHNLPDPVPFRGSAIFMHRWRFHDEGTEGCTAMDAKDLGKVLAWLDQKFQPVLIQAKREDISRFIEIEGFI